MAFFDNLKIMLATDIFDVDNLAEFKALPKVAKTNVSTNEKLSEEITLTRYKDPAVKDSNHLSSRANAYSGHYDRQTLHREKPISI